MSQAPPIRLATIPTLAPAREITLSNGLRTLLIDGVQAAVVRAELIWDAGRPFEPRPLVSTLTDEFYLEGTRGRSAADWEDYFGRYGTHLDQANNLDVCTLGCSTTLKNAPEIFPAMVENLLDPAFEPAALERILRHRRQKLRENLADNDTLAYRMITEAVYGKDHFYGYNSTQERYASITLEELKAYHAGHYVAANATLIVTGHVTDAVVNLLEKTFGRLPRGRRATPRTAPPLPHPPARRHVHKPRAAQTMVRRGRAGVRVGEADFPGLVVLNTLYGGFFGSRLMRNIREEKGLTYGIDSDMETHRFDGTLDVSADVANENLDATLREIELETEKLRQDLVPRAELEMVRAYLSGQLAMNLDGRFGHSRRWRASVIKDYDPRLLLQRLGETVMTITPAELRDLAQRYLSRGGDWEIVLGGAAVAESAQ